VAKLGEFEFPQTARFVTDWGEGRRARAGFDANSEKHGDSTRNFQYHQQRSSRNAMPPNGATQQGVGMTKKNLQVVTYIPKRGEETER